MKNLSRYIQLLTKKVKKYLPSEKKLPFFTLAFILATLVITIVAVQQQQTLVQNASEPAECPTGDTSTLSRDDRQATRAARQAENGGSVDPTDRAATRAARRASHGDVSTTEIPADNGVTQTTTRVTESPTVTSNGAVQILSDTQLNQRKNGFKGQLLVKYKSGKYKKRVEDKVKKRKGKIKKRNDRLKVDVVQIPPNLESQTIADIKSDPDVVSVERDAPAFGLAEPNDTYYRSQYYLNNTGQKIEDLKITATKNIDINAPQAWGKSKGDGIVIAVVDSGIDSNHPDLKGKVISSKNFSDSSGVDNIGHGTFIAGILAANTNNNEGIAGVCPECKLLDAKVLNDNNQTNGWEPVADAIYWAVDEGADVINLSLGSELQNSVLEEAINYAWSKNVVVVAGAGNCGGSDFSQKGCTKQNAKFYPAAYTNVIGVGSIDQNGKLSPTSQRGAWVAILAPGVNIASTTAASAENTSGGGNSKYSYRGGTSYASPMVAGVAALVKGSGINSAAQIRNQIEKSAVALDGADGVSQNGLVNAAKAVGTSDEDSESEVASDNENAPDKSSNTRPTCKPKKVKSNNGKDSSTASDRMAKPSKEPKQDMTSNGSNNPLCKLNGSLPFCNSVKKKRGDCLSNPSSSSKGNTNGNTRTNANGGTGGKNGTETSSNTEGSVTTGTINRDDTTNTNITVNGKPLADGENVNMGDINTGGKTGGNNQTNITIDKSGGTEKVDQSGGNGNQPNNNARSGDCGNNNANSSGNKTSERGIGSNGNGGPGASILCKFFSNLRFCSSISSGKSREKDTDRKDKKDAKASKEKTDDKSNENNKDRKKSGKDVQGATTLSDPDYLIYTSLNLCINSKLRSGCTEEAQEVADLDKDGAVTQKDMDYYMATR